MRLLFLSDNYMESNSRLDPFRQELLSELARRSEEFLFVQTTDFMNWEGEFRSPQDKGRVLAAIRDFAPEAVVSLNGAGLVGAVRSEFSTNVQVHYWYIDNPGRFPASLRQFKSTDRIFCATRFMIEQVCALHPDLGAGQLHYLPFCCDPALFECPTPAPLKVCDVSFVGTLWEPSGFQSLLRQVAKNDQDLVAFLNIVEAYEQDDMRDVVADVGSRFGPVLDPREILNAIDDFLSTRKRLEVLSALSDLDLRIHGTRWSWMNLAPVFSPRLMSRFRLAPIGKSEELAKLYQGSRACISIAHHQAKSGFPIRIFDIMASGTPLVTDRHQELDELFEEEGEFLGYDSPEEARERVVEVVRDREKATRLATRALAVVKARHTFGNRVEAMLGSTAIRRPAPRARVLSRGFSAEGCAPVQWGPNL